MSDPETLAVYASKVQEYVDITDGTARDPFLKRFIKAVPAGGHVLDLGCGPGLAAAVMAQQGLRVTATDAVPEMVDYANAHTGVTAHIATFDDIAGTDLYDGIWANFSLLHADRADMPRHLANLHRATKPQGAFHIALKSGTGSKRDALGRLYTYYTEAELTDLLTQAGFRVTAQDSGSAVGLDGVPADWIALSAHA